MGRNRCRHRGCNWAGDRGWVRLPEIVWPMMLHKYRDSSSSILFITGISAHSGRITAVIFSLIVMFIIPGDDVKS
jgi:hypothetical protein